MSEGNLPEFDPDQLVPRSAPSHISEIMAPFVGAAATRPSRFDKLCCNADWLFALALDGQVYVRPLTQAAANQLETGAVPVSPWLLIPAERQVP